MTGSSLILFSSNIRPRYEQDILDVVAAPRGHVFRFRYETKYVPDHLVQQWSGVATREVLVVYSIQQPAQYHDPAYVPIRLGEVVRTSRDGSMLTIEFALADYRPLRKPEAESERGDGVRAFTKSLCDRLASVGHPGAENGKRMSVSEGVLPTELLPPPSDPAADFETLVEYLAGTIAFAGSYFWRVVAIREEGGTTDLPCKDGRFELDAGRTYRLVVAHRQHRSISTSVSVTVTTDPAIIEFTGEPTFRRPSDCADHHGR
jgi:hypothetical protein